MASLSHSSKEALLHLKKIKPYEGWSLETHRSTKEVRLLRRSVPLTDNFFRDIHYDPVSDNVVGILTKGPPAKAQILVDSTGRPIGRTPAIVNITTWPPGVRSSASTSTSTPTTTERTRTPEPTLSDDQNRELVKYAAFAIGSAIALRVLMSAFFYLYILAFPAVFLYAVQTMPSLESFDAKKELKRVMRGDYLPDDDVNKPKGWLNKTIARATASVTTELATGLGYEVSIMPIIGVAQLATVTVPSVNRSFYWVGAFGKWRYTYSMELESNPQVST
jgi:hypothetical protein